MKSVRIAEFKSRLSKYLRLVQKGAEIVVMDRETPIAKVVPFGPAYDDFRVIPPKKGFEHIRTLKFEPPSKKTDSLRALLAERNRG
ncbi:MAG TPA: type II toxin-antitoxin system Phd/YefM family antitoxin [Bdellovibrionota bacterium]|nr:type II toxin-antitoxin system Phd/YefM family antitoxin [Bdellovibrionota bacterium]